MPEGQGTVLDNTCLLWLSNMFSGSNHDNSTLPILTLGGLGGTLATGRVLNYRDKGDENRKVCSLYLSLMDRMGVQVAALRRRRRPPRRNLRSEREIDGGKFIVDRDIATTNFPSSSIERRIAAYRNQSGS